MRVHLGEFEQILLIVLQQSAHEERYGVQIRQTIEAATSRVISPGALYTALERLERRRLVKSRLGEPTPQRGGKRKRYYQITAAGLLTLEASQHMLARLGRASATKVETS
jgi:DNA-binding PadR family transcriptional regulator